MENFSAPKFTSKHFAALFCIVVFAALLSKYKSNEDKNHFVEGTTYQEVLYKSYFQEQQQKLLTLDTAEIESRKAALEKLSSNPVYKDIVLNRKTSSLYLPVLQLLSESIRNATTYETFSIPEDLIHVTDSDGLAFAITAMSLTFKGGFTEELVEAFERYRIKYGYYGSAGRLVEPNGERGEGIVASYNLTPIFYLISPNDKKLANSIHEAASKVTFKWRSENDRLYPELSNKKAYYSYLHKVDPESHYSQRYDYEMTARELYSAYNENEVAADQIYKGKGIVVTGGVIAIKKDALGDSYVVLQGTSFIGGVHCTMRSEEEAASMSKGYLYNIIGKCEGMILGSVILTDCEVQ